MDNPDEKKGLEEQLKLLIIKANRIRSALAIETNPSIKFQLEIDLAQTEAEIYEVKKKLSDKSGFEFFEDGSTLWEKIKKLHIEEPVGNLHLVNCNRERMKDRFWDEFDEREGEPFQFYFIPACPTQMPPSFSERMIYEILIEELDEHTEAMRYERREGTERPKIYDLPVGRNIERCQHEFRKFFSGFFELKDALTFEDFIHDRLPDIGYKYVVMVFKIRENDWKNYFIDYFNWLLQTFTHTQDNEPKFLFFFVLHIDALHDGCSEEAQKNILAPVQQLVKNHHAAALLTTLEPVPDNDLKTWLDKLGTNNNAFLDDLVETVAKGLRGKDLEQFQKHKRFNMDDIERVQELVYRAANA